MNPLIFLPYFVFFFFITSFFWFSVFSFLFLLLSPLSFVFLGFSFLSRWWLMDATKSPFNQVFKDILLKMNPRKSTFRQIFDNQNKNFLSFPFSNFGSLILSPLGHSTMPSGLQIYMRIPFKNHLNQKQLTFLHFHQIL